MLFKQDLFTEIFEKNINKDKNFKKFQEKKNTFKIEILSLKINIFYGFFA